MSKQAEKKRKCMKCDKEKPEKDGYVRMAGVFFCCKECCGGDEKGKKPGKAGSASGGKPNVCEFC